MRVRNQLLFGLAYVVLVAGGMAATNWLVLHGLGRQLISFYAYASVVILLLSIVALGWTVWAASHRQPWK